MEPGVKPLANPAVICRQILADEAVLVNPDTGAALALNPSGCVVWQLVDGERSVEQIIAAVCDHYTDVPPSVTQDVTELLDTLVQDGFVGFEWVPERDRHE